MVPPERFELAKSLFQRLLEGLAVKKKSQERKKTKQTMMMHQCRVCNQVKPISPSRVKASNWICSPCANRQRLCDNATYLAVKLATLLRKQGVKAPYPSTAFARQVLAKCSAKSVLTGEGNIKRLCIVKIDPNGGWTLDNAVIVTSGEAYALTRTTGAGCREVLLSKRPLVNLK
jgi:ribosomal protein L37AE/L43A